MDDLYTRYRQRLRKSLFESGLITAFVACIICLCVLFSYHVNILYCFQSIYSSSRLNRIESMSFSIMVLIFQMVTDIMLTLLTIIIICGVLIALQFPIVMSSPIAALGFAVLITVSLGSVSAKVGTILAPLPIFALILVSEIRTWRYCFRIIYTSFNSNQQRRLNTERDYAQNGKCQNLFGCISLLFFSEIEKGCSHNASHIVASISGFGCNPLDNPFWFSNPIEYR